MSTEENALHNEREQKRLGCIYIILQCEAPTLKCRGKKKGGFDVLTGKKYAVPVLPILVLLHTLVWTWCVMLKPISAFAQ